MGFIYEYKELELEEQEVDTDYLVEETNWEGAERRAEDGGREEEDRREDNLDKYEV